MRSSAWVGPARRIAHRRRTYAEVSVSAAAKAILRVPAHRCQGQATSRYLFHGLTTALSRLLCEPATTHWSLVLSTRVSHETTQKRHRQPGVDRAHFRQIHLEQHRSCDTSVVKTGLMGNETTLGMPSVLSHFDSRAPRWRHCHSVTLRGAFVSSVSIRGIICLGTSLFSASRNPPEREHDRTVCFCVLRCRW